MFGKQITQHYILLPESIQFPQYRFIFHILTIHSILLTESIQFPQYPFHIPYSNHSFHSFCLLFVMPIDGNSTVSIPTTGLETKKAFLNRLYRLSIAGN